MWTKVLKKCCEHAVLALCASYMMKKSTKATVSKDAQLTRILVLTHSYDGLLFFKQVPRVHCIEFTFKKLKEKMDLNLGKINYTGKEGNTKGMIVTPSVKNSTQYSFALIFLSSLCYLLVVFTRRFFSSLCFGSLVFLIFETARLVVKFS